jgi:hypothetical protein
MIQRILGQDQNVNNTLKLYKGESGCCGDSATICQYEVTYTQSRTLSVLNITEDGVARALNCVPASTSAADVKAAILATLEAAGYVDDGMVPFAGVEVVDLGSTLRVRITGNVVPVSFTSSGGTETFDADCTLKNLCTFTAAAWTGGTTGSAGTTMKINGVTYDTGTATPGTTAASTVDTNITALLTSAGVLGSVDVTANGSTSYTVVITLSEHSNTFSLGGVLMTKSACAGTYI